MEFVECDVFGNEIKSDPILEHPYSEDPASILDTKRGEWRNRVNTWKSLGLKSELGRSVKVFHMESWFKDKKKPQLYNSLKDISIFDPALCEIVYRWLCPAGGKILDPFAGGSVRGIVANYLGYNYTGIDIREEQVESNREQAAQITPANPPKWVVGDSSKVLDNVTEEFDLVFSCPPYGDLEVYSDIPGDISNIHSYEKFLNAYKQIICKCVQKLKRGGGGGLEDGNYVGFVPDTIAAFVEAGMVYQDEVILLNEIASASMRAKGNMKTKKLVKIHQNILIFRKQ